MLELRLIAYNAWRNEGYAKFYLRCWWRMRFSGRSTSSSSEEELRLRREPELEAEALLSRLWCFHLVEGDV